MELEGKELGCWCKPSPCHGDILIKLFKERQCINTSSLRSNHQVITPVLNLCGINEDDDDNGGCKDLDIGNESQKNDCLEVTSSLPFQRKDDLPVNVTIETEEICEVVLGAKENCLGNGRVGTAESHDLLTTAKLENSISEQDVREVLFEAGYSTETIDEIIAIKAMN